MSVIEFIRDNWSYLFELSGGHIVLSGAAVLVAVAIAVPLGAVVGHMHRFSFIAINGSNVLRALPTLALVAIGIGIYGFGFLNIMIALVVLGAPLILTNTYTAVADVDRGVVEAARGMGMNELAILLKVELPNSIPLMMSGIRTAWVYVVATAYLAGLAGSPGTLGEVITNIESFRLEGVLGATVFSVTIAFAGDFLLALVQKLITPAGLKVGRTSEVASV